MAGLLVAMLGALALSGCAAPAATFLSIAGGPIIKAAFRAAIGPGEAEGDSHALILVAERMRSEGKIKPAAALYARAHAIDPKDPAPVVGLGECLLALGADADAANAFQRALLLDANNGQALHGLGKAHLMLHQPDLAASRFETLLAADPRDAQAMNGLGIAQAMAGNHSRAQETYRAGLAIDPANEELRNNLGLSLAMTGDLDGAISALQVIEPAGGPVASGGSNLTLIHGLAALPAALPSSEAEPVAIAEARLDEAVGALQVVEPAAGPAAGGEHNLTPIHGLAALPETRDVAFLPVPPGLPVIRTVAVAPH